MIRPETPVRSRTRVSRREVRAVKKGLLMLALHAQLAACASVDDTDEIAGLSLPLANRDQVGPDEVTLHGRRFLRNDLVSEAQWLEMQDPENLRPVEEPADELLVVDRTDEDVRRLAIQLMAHVQNEYGYYVQAEPDLETARKILDWDENDTADRASVEPATTPRVGRSIINTDDRSPTTCPGCTPHSWLGFSQIGGSGALIGWTTLYTAAHNIYDNQPVAVDGDGKGFFCSDQSTDTTTAPPNTNPCDGPGEPGDPRWSFFNGLVTCAFTASVSNAWTTLTSTDWWTIARHDYAVVEFNCNPGLGHMGSTIQSGGILDTFQGKAGGYPARFPCPAGSRGSAADCPAGTFLFGGGASPPWTATTAYWSATSFYFVGDSESAHTWRFDGDTTMGMSGGPVMNANNKLTGVNSNSQSSPLPVKNRFNRLTSTVWNFIVANSSL